VIRWKAMSLLLLSVALLLAACADAKETDDDRSRAAYLIEQDEEAAAALESESVVPEDGDPPSDDDGDSGQSDATQDDDETAQPPVDDETARCDLSPGGPDPQVVVHSITLVKDALGNLNVNVQMCDPVDPLNPFGHLFSGFFICGEWFGFEMHDKLPTVLGSPTEANTRQDGSFGFGVDAPVPDPWPSALTCDHASWGNPDGQVIPGQVVIDLPPLPPGGPDDGNNPGSIVTDLLNTGGS
jgi:hypothetical protein